MVAFKLMETLNCSFDWILVRILYLVSLIQQVSQVVILILRAPLTLVAYRFDIKSGQKRCVKVLVTQGTFVCAGVARMSGRV